MTGKYDLELYNNRIHYHLVIKRNITIIQGNSATGKSEFIRLLSAYNANPRSSGITLRCDRSCTVLTAEDWESRIASYSQRILFLDEDALFMKTHAFAEAALYSDNYFVIITRDKLPQLPYSIEEIYTLHDVSDSQRYRNARQVYNEMRQLYHSEEFIHLKPESAVTEDSNSGNQFFSSLYGQNCTSANGKTNIKRYLQAADSNHPVLAIVDGAAFGPEIAQCVETILWNDNGSAIYAPDSFEYLLLKSGIQDCPSEVLEKTYDYADSKEYVSWEEFYTVFLSDTTQNTVYQYSKSHIPKSYLTKGNIEKVRSILPEEIQNLGSEKPQAIKNHPEGAKL